MRIRTPDDLLDYLAAERACHPTCRPRHRYQTLSMEDGRVPSDMRNSIQVRQMLKSGCSLIWEDGRCKLVELPAKYERLIP